jgi:hypothetical protein
MIELSQEQQQPLQAGEPVRVRDNGQQNELLRFDVYDGLVEETIDHSPWTPMELDLLREESVALLDRYGRTRP